MFSFVFTLGVFVFVVSYEKNVLNFPLLFLSFDLWNIYEIYLGNKTFSTEFVMTIQSLLMWFYRFVWCTNAFTPFCCCCCFPCFINISENNIYYRNWLQPKSFRNVIWCGENFIHYGNLYPVQIENSINAIGIVQPKSSIYYYLSHTFIVHYLIANGISNCCMQHE